MLCVLFEHDVEHDFIANADVVNYVIINIRSRIQTSIKVDICV
jgi:hypothetical protein